MRNSTDSPRTIFQKIVEKTFGAIVIVPLNGRDVESNTYLILKQDTGWLILRDEVTSI